MEKGQKRNKRNQQETTDNEVVLSVLIHCQGCARDLFNTLKGYDGVEEINVDSENNKVTVKGKKVDPMKVLERIRKKYSKNVELIHPKPSAINKEEMEPEEQQPEQKPEVKIVVLKMLMHCEGCARDIKKEVLRIRGVLDVEPNMEKSVVTVKGEFEDPANLVEKIKKRLGKHVEILKQEVVKKKEKPKNQEKQNNNNNNNNIPCTSVKEVTYQYPPHCCQNYASPCRTLSDENVFACSIM